MFDEDIHGLKRQLTNLTRKIESSTEISEQNKKDVLSFKDHCFAEGIGYARILRYLERLHWIMFMLEKNFRSCGKQDIIALMGRIEASNYAEWTKHDYKVCLKKFFRWLRGTEEYPEEVRWLKTTMKNNSHKLPEELLTEDDIKKLCEAADNPRDRALIISLWESGCRIGELATLRIRNVAFDKYGARLIVKGKTGMRRVRVIASAPALATWISNHPDRNNPDAPLWVCLGSRGKGNMVRYEGLRRALKQAAKKAGLKKKVNPHLFRHSRATFLADKLTEAQMKEFFGWTQGSDMAATYVHLSGRETEDSLLALAGLKKKDEKASSKLLPKKCPRCGKTNSPTSEFCENCRMALDLRTVVEMEKTMADLNRKMTRKVQENPAGKRKMARFFSEMGMADVFEKVWHWMREER